MHPDEVLLGTRLLLSGAVGLLIGFRLLSAISVSHPVMVNGCEQSIMLHSDGYLLLVRSTRVEQASPNRYFGSSSTLNTQAVY